MCRPVTVGERRWEEGRGRVTCVGQWTVEVDGDDEVSETEFVGQTPRGAVRNRTGSRGGYLCLGTGVGRRTGRRLERGLYGGRSGVRGGLLTSVGTPTPRVWHRGDQGPRCGRVAGRRGRGQ